MNKLTATELIEIGNQLESFGYKSIDAFLFQRFGFDYDELPFINEVRSYLNKFYKKVETPTKYGYNMIEWNYVDLMQ